MLVEVASLHIYPVKSLRGISLASSVLERRGLRYDRRWMIVGPDGQFFTQRKIAQMALFDTEFADGFLSIARKGRPDLKVPVQPQGPERRVRVWRSWVKALHVSDEADAWLTEALGTPCSLVKMADSARRTAKGPRTKPHDVVSFADSNPLLLAGEASLDDLNRRLEKAIPMARFRPNIVVRGSAPYEEDSWRSLSIGRQVRLHETNRCGRCIVTTIDPTTARSSDEPLRTLATYRRDGKYVMFGSHFAPDALGELRVGDTLTFD